jgi:hypothetical protein
MGLSEVEWGEWQCTSLQLSLIGGGNLWSEEVFLEALKLLSLLCEIIGHFAMIEGCSNNDNALGEMATKHFSTKVSILQLSMQGFFCFVLWATIIYRSCLSSRSYAFSFCFCNADHLKRASTITLHISTLSTTIAPYWVPTAITKRSSKNPKPFKMRALWFE